MKIKEIAGLKIGSSLITNGNGALDKKFMISVCHQVATLMEQGYGIPSVCSGAVASDPNPHRSKNLRAGVGQIRSISLWYMLYEIYRISISQHMLTDRDLLGPGKNITVRTILEALNEGVVPIINGNDVVNDKELKALDKCADNDVLFKSVCISLPVNIAIIGINEQGLLDHDGNVIHEVRLKDVSEIMTYARKGSELGFGDDGMATKIKVLSELTAKGITAVMAPGREENFIIRAIAGEKNFGTRFLP